MNIKSFGKIAAVSAIAMVAAMHAAGVVAAPVQIGDPVQVDITATVENTIDVTVTNPVRFGQIGAMNSQTAADTATARVAPNDALTDDPGTGYGTASQASIVFDPGDVANTGAADVDITGAFANTDLYVTYDTCADLAGPGAEVFVLHSIQDNLPTPNSHDCTAAAAYGTYTFGSGTTDGAGALSFNIGATIDTDGSSDAAYTEGAYTGSVQMYVTY